MSNVVELKPINLYLVKVVYPSPRVDYLRVEAVSEEAAREEIEKNFKEEGVDLVILDSKETTDETIQEDVDNMAEESVTIQ